MNASQWALSSAEMFVLLASSLGLAHDFELHCLRR
jgi:hypothetical protein